MTKPPRVITVPIGGGAQMSVPGAGWIWCLRYGKDMSTPPICSDRMMAAGVCESFRYLIQECTRDEAWRRIKIMRTALKDADAELTGDRK